MEERKKRTPLQNFLIIIGVIVGWMIVLPLLLIFLSFIMPPSYDEKIAITEGEFPFKLEYEMDGERKVVENIWVIKYAGERQNFELGAYRTWNVYLKDRKGKIILYETDNVILHCYPQGEPDYFMGGDGYKKGFAPDFPYVVATTYGKGFNIVNNKSEILYEDELYEKYKFKWIGAEYADPIVNDFNKNK